MPKERLLPGSNVCPFNGKISDAIYTKRGFYF
jgi:hypothetical protein